MTLMQPTGSRSLSVAAALAALLAGGLLSTAPSSAATATVTITAAGYVPVSTGLSTGDTLTFANADAVVHEVDLKQTSGFTCTVSPLVVQPATQQSCIFTTAGTYTFTDPKQNGPAFRGTITVTAPVAPTVSLTASAPVVRFGSAATLSGAVTPAKAGVTVEIQSMEYGATGFTRLLATTTASNGSFSAPVTPRLRTTYRAQIANGSATVLGPDVTIQVRPRVSFGLRDVRGRYGYFRTSVASTLSYAGERVFVQRRTSSGAWGTVRSVILGQFSSAKFRVRLTYADSRFRVFVPTSVAGPGYLAGFSRVILVSR